MPRKTKEQIAIENDENIDNITTVESTKKRTSKSKATNNTESSKAKKSTTSKTKPKKTKKETTAKKATSKTEPKKTKKETTTKKATKSKVQTKTVSDKKTATTRKSKKKIEVVEYYDLPYRYNQTVVKVLAQTPNNLFIYWDISDVDRQNFEKHYGENFFENTRPVLIVHNNTLGYSFEVEINDFANSWYLHVADSKCDYKIELGRRPILKTEKINEDYIYVAISNEIESPNDRILFDKNQKMVYFRNVKNGKLTGKSINSMIYIRLYIKMKM